MGAKPEPLGSARLARMEVVMMAEKRSVWIIEMRGDKKWFPSIHFGHIAFKTEERANEKMAEIIKQNGDHMKYRATRYAAQT
jgi:hypothetical protein